jgi:KDO2-lipid IV(A) lauroyltransferase
MQRWYAHNWNTVTSLRLILTIIPRVPRFLVPAIAVPTTAVCLAYMGRERRAARRNLARILGTRGWRLHRATWSLFYNFSKFMVSYCDLAELTSEELLARLDADASKSKRISDSLAQGKGLIVLTAHFGNWEAGVRLLEAFGTPVNVVMQVDPDNPAEGALLRLRQSGAVRVIRVGDDAGAVIALRAALARNEILAIQGDRLNGEHEIPAVLFGEPLPLPAGPFLLAYLTRAPILPAFVLLDGWRRFRVEIGEPLQFPQTGNREADLKVAVGSYAAILERMVRQHPDQWFNFYDPWQPAAVQRGGA